jgi:serine/threonine protein phosphatase PrpC
VIKEPCFPAEPKLAILRGFEKAEKNFLEDVVNSDTLEVKDKSGSCAIVVLIVGQNCYVANVGDSRAILSAQNGNRMHAVSRDHKPVDPLEKERISLAGG